MTLVIGLGSPDRGDDAAGLAVCEALAAVPGLRVRTIADAALLPVLWEDEPDVVVVDAVRDPAREPGTLVVLPLAAGVALPQEGSTHGFDLGAAVELAAAVGRLPARLSLVGVVGSDFALGAPVAPEVLAGIRDAVAAVLDLAGAVAP